MSDEVLPVFELSAATVEKIGCQVSFSVDPTGTPPQFTVSVDGDGLPTGWQNGSWDGAWAAGVSPALGRVRAKSPTIGVSGTLVVTPGDFHVLYVKWTGAGETPVRRVCYLSFT